MFTLRLYDRNGTELHEKDIVAVSDGSRFRFYSEVKFIKKECVIAPFHTFCFHSFVKVDKVPENAKKGSEERYNIWYVCDGEDADLKSDDFETYLLGWRTCENQIDKRSWRITKNEPKPLTLFEIPE